MMSLTLKDIKLFMNQLLAGSAFDGLCLSEAVITTGNTFTIDGALNTAFFSDEERSELSSLNYCMWKSARPHVYNVVKGKRIPAFMRIVFALPDETVRSLIEECETDVTAENVNALFINIRFHDDSLTLTTASSLKVFTMDKSLDDAFEQYVMKFLEDAGISWEE